MSEPRELNELDHLAIEDLITRNALLWELKEMSTCILHHFIASYGVHTLGWDPKVDQFSPYFSADGAINIPEVLKDQEEHGHTDGYRQMLREKLTNLDKNDISKLLSASEPFTSTQELENRTPEFIQNELTRQIKTTEAVKSGSTYWLLTHEALKSRLLQVQLLTESLGRLLPYG